MFSHQEDSEKGDRHGLRTQVGTSEPKLPAIALAGLSVSVIVATGVALQWIFAAWAVAALLALGKHHLAPATEEDVLAEERWLQAVVDTWSVGRSI